MEPLINPIDRALLKSELTAERFLRHTNAGNNTIFMVNAHNAPHTMQEIGRLREYTFREAGGGTGKSVDIDEFDTAEIPFQQLIVWNNDAEEIVSAYRFILGKEVLLDENGYPNTPTSELFNYSQEFIQTRWTDCIELGRSFVQPKYQAGNDMRIGMYALDNIWDGLGALTICYPEARYFMGKMTLYNHYNREARNMILAFMSKHFQGDYSMINPKSNKENDNIPQAICDVFNDDNNSINDNFKILNKRIRELNESIPPLIKTYISLSPKIEYYGITPNPHFGPVEEICILVNISDIYESKRERHINTI